MTYEDSIRILLNGITGVNAREISRATRRGNATISRFMSGEPVSASIVEDIGMFTWRRMNAKVLLSPEDFEGARD